MESKTFCASIKEQTAAAHERAESQQFIQSLLAGQLNVRSLVLLLESLVPVYEELERQLVIAADRDGVVAMFDHRRLDRAPRLRADLASFGRRIPSRHRVETDEYVRIVRESAASPQRLLAHHYTRYVGHLAGGQVIASLVRRHYGVAPESLTYYGFTDLGNLVHYRRQYRALLDLLPWSPVEQAEFITECSLAYEANARLFAALAVESGLRPSRKSALAGFMSSERAHVRA